MIKNKEKMADEKSEKMQVRIKKYISDMEKLLDEKKFTIEAIEREWEKMEEYSKEVFREINEEIIRSSTNEREAIKQKKTNTRSVGSISGMTKRTARK